MSPLSVPIFRPAQVAEPPAESEAPPACDGDGAQTFFQLVLDPVGGAPAIGQQGSAPNQGFDTEIYDAPSQHPAFQELDVAGRLDDGTLPGSCDEDRNGDEISIDDITWQSADDLRPGAADQARSPVFTPINSEPEAQPAPIADRIIRRLEQAGAFSRDAGGQLTFGLAFAAGPLAGIRLEVGAPAEGRVALRARSVRPATPLQRECLSDLVDRLEARGLCVERVGF